MLVCSLFWQCCFLRVSRDAVNRWVCRAFTCDTSGFLHFLSLVDERNQRISARCICVHVRVLGPEGGTPLEDLLIGSFPRSFAKRSNAIAFLRALIAGNGSVPGERNALALVLNTIEFQSPLKTGYDF